MLDMVQDGMDNAQMGMDTVNKKVTEMINRSGGTQWFLFYCRTWISSFYIILACDIHVILGVATAFCRSGRCILGAATAL